jgi:thermostable 8-oxoguanine DNA glycosylase
MPTIDFLANFDRSDDQLAAFAAFCILSTGVSAGRSFQTASNLLCTAAEEVTPKERLLELDEKGLLPGALKETGYRFFNQKARSLASLARSDVDLRHGDFKDLRRIDGFAFKTIPFFLTYTRKDSPYFIPDIHILRAMEKDGCRDVKSKDGDPVWPGSMNAYNRLNAYFNAMAAKQGMSVMELDYKLWSQAALKDESKTMAEFLGRAPTRREMDTFGFKG